MKDILKYTKVNVKVTDKETDKTLFRGHNLFVTSGRIFIAETFMGTISGNVINPTLFACDLGADAGTPVIDDVDLISYIPTCSVGVTAGYPAALSGSPTGIHFRFSFVNGTGGDVTIKELGLFYRPDSASFPQRLTAPEVGTMLARIKTTLSSIVVGDTRTITIDWKIIF